MKTARDLALIAMFSALLIGVQFAFSFTYGIEFVSVTLAMFSLVFGWKKGLAVAVSFSLLRCILFGFFPTVVVLYLAYYPLYAAICALIGKIRGRAQYPVLVIAVAIMTVCFTLIDDVVTPLMLGMKGKAWLGYFYGSFLAMAPQTVCAAVSTLVLYMPIKRLFEKLKISYYNIGKLEETTSV